MNRLTAILLAMAALFVHVFVVHRDAWVSFGPAFDDAHAAYRVARNLAREGVAAWWIAPDGSTVTGGLWSYPSPLLVWVAAVFEFFSFSVTRCAQALGILCALWTVLASTRFDKDRIAGVVPALLLVTSGAVAATGASGTEWPLVMALFVTAFVALERSRSKLAALTLALFVVSRPEAIVVAAAMFVQTVIRRARRRPNEKITSPLAFAPAALAVAFAEWCGAGLVDGVLRVATFDGAAARHGLAQLVDFFVSTASPGLLVFPLVALALRELSPVGRRALTLAVLWVVTVCLLGGGPTAYDLAFIPALPVTFIAIQQGISRALDTYRASMERLVWVSLGLAISASLFASRFPGDVGGIALRDAQMRFFQARAEPAPGRTSVLARASLHGEIRHTSTVRRIGVFLRTRLPEDASILTPWPGALGYLSRVNVLDLFGRTSRVLGEPRPWSPTPGEVDLRAAIEPLPDYIVPTTSGLDALRAGGLGDLLPESLMALDPSDGPELRAELAALIAQYEIVVTTGQVRDELRGDRTEWAQPLVLLRRRGIQPAPEIFVVRTKTHLEVRAGFAASSDESVDKIRRLPQVFDASVELVDPDGTRITVDPVGRELTGSSRTLEGIVVDPRWAAPVTLARIERAGLKRPGAPVRIEAALTHHGAPAGDARSNATAPLRYPLR